MLRLFGSPQHFGGLTPGDVWTPIAIMELSPPAATASALVFLRTMKNEGGVQYLAHFDDVTLVALETLTIPAAASIHGSAGNFPQRPLGHEPLVYEFDSVVRARYRCFAGQTCGSATKSFGIGKRSEVHYEDVIGTLFGSPETAGAIELSWEPTLGAISASSRVYTPSLPAPTTGSGIPARKSSEARTRALFWASARAAGRP